MNNDLINAIAAIAFPFSVFVVAWLVFRNERIKAKKPTINDNYNQARPMATYKQKTLADAHIEANAEDEITADELFDLMGDELKEYEA